MVPDVLTSQLRDEAAGTPVGLRVQRIATHHAVRSRGLGTHLLGAIRTEFEADLDWLGVGYGATPELIEFWHDNGFSTVHLSTTRNDRSGKFSVLMLDPLSEAGQKLCARHSRRFARRIAGVLGDALSEIDPEVVRWALRASRGDPTLDLETPEWELLAAMADGPALFDVDPQPFRELTVRHLLEPAETADCSPEAERLLVEKCLQAHSWAEVTERRGFQSTTECKRALGRAVRALLDVYGSDAAQEEARRYHS